MKEAIKLGNGFAIQADDLNIILFEEKTNTNEKSGNFGKPYFSKVGYYPNIESLIKNMIYRKINIEVQNQQTLNDLFESVNDSISLLHDNLLKIVGELRK